MMRVLCAAVFTGTIASDRVHGENVVITIQNSTATDGFSLTPFWVAVHNGEFDVWSGGESAANFPGLEALAEEGDTSGITQAFADGPAQAAGGVQATVLAEAAAPPVFSPGETASLMLNVSDTAANRYFSYASMVIPSNDLFVATSVPTTYEVFDADGRFTGPMTIEILGRDVVDAGTEVNDIAGGAAFSALGGDSADEAEPLTDLIVRDPDGTFLSSIVGTETATGASVGTAFGPDDVVARITISRMPERQLAINVESAAPPGGSSLTPFWVAAHNGGFDVWSAAAFADEFPGLEEIAEGGDTAPLSSAFSASDAGLAGGVQATIVGERRDLPVFSPGEAQLFTLGVGDTTVNRYFSYASMVIPSNDLFVATSVPTTHMLYDEAGVFQGPLTIEIYGRDIVDAGTEVNDIAGGAAFSALGGDSVDEREALADIYVRDPDATFLSSTVGTGTGDGETLSTFFGPDELVARITISEVPVPQVMVTIENTMPAGQFFLTPFWVAAHDGNFDIWSGGASAADFPGLEDIAEEGNTGPLDVAFVTSLAGLAGGTSATVLADALAPPVFSPQESISYPLPVGDPTLNRYFSYASMVIPSNDLFVATSVPTTHEIFDADGTFLGPVVIEVFGRDVVDAGTEVNNIAGGAAFSTLGGEPADEAEALTDIYVRDPAAEYLGTIVGTDTASGDTVQSIFGADDVVARITISRMPATSFVRGDANASGSVDISDPIRLVGTMFFGAPPLPCRKSADVNDSGVIDISDPVWLLNYLFLRAAPPPAPFPGCGTDDTFDELSCDEFLFCPPL